MSYMYSKYKSYVYFWQIIVWDHSIHVLVIFLLYRIRPCMEIGIFVKSMVEGGAAHVVRITNGESVKVKYIAPHCLCTGWQDTPWRPDTGSGQLQSGRMHAGRVSLLL